MATHDPMPGTAKLKLMPGLLFDGPDVEPGEKSEIAPPSASWAGLYVGDDGKAVAACAAGGALAANSTAALSMPPPGVAKDAARTRELTDVMVANLQQIMNICSRLPTGDGSAHLKLDRVCPSKARPTQPTALPGSAQGRVELELNVPTYGAGTLAVAST
jgi:hypothetical protein